MAELKRKDEELTTADLAGRTGGVRDNEDRHIEDRFKEDRPKLVRNQPPSRWDAPAASTPVDSDVTTSPAAAPSAARETVLPATHADPAVTGTSNEPTPLFSESEFGDFRSRWSNIQTGFVDEPRRAVEDADNLVASLMKKLAEGFANERAGLEKQWDRGDNVSTEDLRLALQRYRSFFDRLLKV